MPEIKTYIGCKIIQAFSQTRKMFMESQGKEFPKNEEDQKEGRAYPIR